MAFAGEDCQQVGNGKARQRCIKVMGVAYGDNCVAIAVKDEGWRERFVGLGVVWGYQTAGDIDDGSDAGGVARGEGKG